MEVLKDEFETIKQMSSEIDLQLLKFNFLWLSHTKTSSIYPNGSRYTQNHGLDQVREVEGLIGEDGRSLTLKEQIQLGNEAIIVPLNQPMMHEATGLNQFSGNEQINAL